MKIKTALITGATGDIGQAILNKLKHSDYNTIAPARDELDLNSIESIDDYIERLTNNNVDIDCFVYCAGINNPINMLDLTLDDLNKTMQVNAISVFYMSQSLLKNSLLRDGGAIVAISSLYGDLGRKGRLAYSTSKHALNGIIKTMALELGDKNIKVNAISPGFVKTKMTYKNNSAEIIEGWINNIPLGKLADVNDIAALTCFLCSSENSYINGQNIVIDGGFSIGGFQR